MTALLAVINRSIDRRNDPLAFVAYVSLAGLVLGSKFVSARSIVRLSEKAGADFRKGLVRSSLGAPLRMVEELGPARVLAALTDDTVVLSEGLRYVPLALVDFVIVIACLAYLAWLSLKIFAVVLGLLGLGVATFQFARGVAIRQMARARNTQDRLFEALHDAIDGVKELKLNQTRREYFLAEELDAAADTFRRQQTRGITIFIVSSLWAFGVFLGVICILLFVKSAQTSAKILSAYILTIVYMNSALNSLFTVLPVIDRGNLIITRLRGLGMLLEPGIGEFASSAREPAGSWGSIRLQGVSHSYRHEADDSRVFVLGPVNLALTPGKVTFIIGGNGSGKSTLVKVLVGLYLPETGTITIDGTVISDENREQYRQNFSAVFTDYHLFRRPVGRIDPRLQRQAEVYLKKLQLAHKVQIVDGRFSTTSLSSGQRKRLALLSAYLEDRRVYVFDEWAADQDPMFRRFFYTEVLRDLAARGKAVVCVTHDDKYFSLAHERLKLDAGQVVGEEETGEFIARMSRS